MPMTNPPRPMTIAQYHPTEGSTTYRVGSSAVLDRPILTVAKVLENSSDPWLTSSGAQSDDSFDDAETVAIEQNAQFYTTIVRRLVSADELVDASSVL